MNQFVLQAERKFQTAHTADSESHNTHSRFRITQQDLMQIKFTLFREQYYTKK